MGSARVPTIRSTFVDSIVSSAVSKSGQVPVRDFVKANTQIRVPMPRRAKEAPREPSPEPYEEFSTISLYHQIENVRDVQFCEKSTDVNIPGRIPGPSRLYRQPFTFTAAKANLSHEPMKNVSPEKRRPRVDRSITNQNRRHRLPGLDTGLKAMNRKPKYSDHKSKSMNSRAPVGEIGESMANKENVGGKNVGSMSWTHGPLGKWDPQSEYGDSFRVEKPSPRAEIALEGSEAAISDQGAAKKSFISTEGPRRAAVGPKVPKSSAAELPATAPRPPVPRFRPLKPPISADVSGQPEPVREPDDVIKWPMMKQNVFSMIETPYLRSNVSIKNASSEYASRFVSPGQQAYHRQLQQALNRQQKVPARRMDMRRQHSTTPK